MGVGRCPCSKNGLNENHHVLQYPYRMNGSDSTVTDSVCSDSGPSFTTSANVFLFWGKDGWQVIVDIFIYVDVVLLWLLPVIRKKRRRTAEIRWKQWFETGTVQCWHWVFSGSMQTDPDDTIFAYSLNLVGESVNIIHVLFMKCCITDFIFISHQGSLICKINISRFG